MEEVALFQIKEYDPYGLLPVPCAIVLLGGTLAAIHAPQAWNGREVKALISVAMGMSVAIAAIVSAALEWTRIQQSNASVQSHVADLNSDLAEEKRNQEADAADLNQQIEALKEESLEQATNIEQQETRLEKYAESEEELRAQIKNLELENATLTQQLTELQKKFKRQATTTKELTGKLSKTTKSTRELKGKYDTLSAKAKELAQENAMLNQQLSEARGLGTGKKSSNIQKEVLETEKTFFKQMTELRDLLDAWREADSITESQLTLLSKGLGGVIEQVENFKQQGVKAYYDIEFMKEYYAALTIMVMNFKEAGDLLNKLKVKELPKAQSLFAGPMQRVGRHRMLFEELLKTSPAQKALKELKTIADRVNTSQKCNDELAEIQDLLRIVVEDRGKGKTTNLVDCAQQLVGIKAKDPNWMEYWFGTPKDLNVALLALVDKLSYAAQIIEDKQILQKINACAGCLNNMISNDNNNNDESPTESLLKLIKDRITRCG